LLASIVRWRVRKEDHEKHFEFLRYLMAWQRSHPEECYYTRSRLLTMTEEGSSEENWMFLDEYENREAHDKQMKAEREGTELAKFLKDEALPRWNALAVPGSRKRGEVWAEVEELTVAFRK